MDVHEPSMILHWDLVFPLHYLGYQCGIISTDAGSHQSSSESLKLSSLGYRCGLQYHEPSPNDVRYVRDKIYKVPPIV